MAKAERPVRDVKCCDCGAQTNDARLRFSDVIKYGESWFDPETVSAVTCYVCPECGRTYISGGTTTTKIAYKNENNPYQKDLKKLHGLATEGMNFDKQI